MYAGFLYRMDYEDYKKREQDLDEKIKQLSTEGEDEEIVPLDEAYIIRMNNCEEEYGIPDGYFLLLVGDHHYDANYIEEVLYGKDVSYCRYKELLDKDTSAMSIEERRERYTLSEKFIPLSSEDAPGVAEEIVYEESDFGELIKQIF